MAVPTSIKTLLSGNVVEWARVEFKETWDAEASLKTICAFANDLDNWGGGYIVIGVEEDNGIPKHPFKGVPIDKVDGYLKDMLNACKKIQPEYMPIVEVAEYEGKKFIVIWAPGGYLRPYQSPKTMAKDEKTRIPFPEGEGGNQIVERIFKGPLHQQLREALLYVRNSVLEERIIKYSDRAEADHFYNYPYEAIEEALANAVYHKGYDVREPIEVRVLSDRIEILSHPGADRSVSEEGLKSYRVFNRCYRNRRIGEFLKEMHLTEGRNTGFRKILNALERNGSLKPLFETDNERTFFATTLFIHPLFISQNETINETINDTINVRTKLSLTKIEKAVLDVLKIDNTLSFLKISEYSGMSRSSVARALKGLKEKKIIIRQGAKKNGVWAIVNE